MQEENIKAYLTGSLSLKDFCQAMDSATKKRANFQSFHWEDHHGEESFTIGLPHFKQIFEDFIQGHFRPVHLQFIGTVLRRSAYYKRDPMEDTEKLNLIIYELSELNIDTPNIARAKIDELSLLVK